MKKRIAGIDFGTARIGLAVSDERKFLARALAPISAKPLPGAAQKILDALKKEGEIEAIVMGLPLHFNGKESPMCTQVRAFAEELKQLSSLPIIFWDERLTTAEVERTLKEAALSRKKRAPLVDGLAACAILQNYLDSISQK